MYWMTAGLAREMTARKFSWRLVSVIWTSFRKALEGLAKKVEAMGLKFGLWFEPEMVNHE